MRQAPSWPYAIRGRALIPRISIESSTPSTPRNPVEPAWAWRYAAPLSMLMAASCGRKQMSLAAPYSNSPFRRPKRTHACNVVAACSFPGHAKQAKLPDLRRQLRCASASRGLECAWGASGANVRPHEQEETMMPKFVIEREFAGAGKWPKQELQAI